MIGPLSSIRIRIARSSGVSRSATKLFTCLSQLWNACSTRGVVDPGSSSSAPCDPAYATPPTPTSRRTSATERPETHATQP